MTLHIRRLIISPLLFSTFLTFASSTVMADEQDRAEQALADLLFDMDMENVTYSVRGDGFVDILFGPSVSKEDYWATVQAIKKHPEIDGVLPGRGVSDFCAIP